MKPDGCFSRFVPALVHCGFLGNSGTAINKGAAQARYGHAIRGLFQFQGIPEACGFFFIFRFGFGAFELNVASVNPCIQSYFSLFFRAE
jgi:hypothetical protein